MVTDTSAALHALIAERLRERNRVSAAFVPHEAERLARASHAMAQRFLRGGRLLACGRDQYATDAQHVSVEFVHPVIVGKRALPALDLSVSCIEGLPAIVRPDDMVMGFGPPGGDPVVTALLEAARRRGAMTLALPGDDGDYAVTAISDDPFIHQELIEVLYHMLWETVHVFLEHRERGHDVGDLEFLYPFLGRGRQDTETALVDVAASIRAKAEDDERLREAAAAGPARIAEAVMAIDTRLSAGGTLLFFGNGGSATDANDWALDCSRPPKPYRPVAAISLAMEAATLSAIANDIGTDAMFLRQLIAHGRPGDVAVALSTSGGSKNIIAALEEARRRGMMTVGVLGCDGGEIVRRGLVDHPIVVACDYIPRIQEVQASIYHVMVDALHAIGRAGRTH